MKSLFSTEFKNLPTGIQESIAERTQIKAAIYNTRLYMKDLQEAKKWAKGHEVEEAIINGRTHSLNHVYENELLPAQELADKYRELWSEKYYKTRLEAEFLLGI